MSKINGLSLKSLKKFKDHEGLTCYSGNLYLGRKKIGTWSQDYMSGPDHFDLMEPYSEDELNRRLKELYPNDKTPYGNGYDLECLMCDLLKLSLDEKEFKKAKKNGYIGILLVSDGWRELCWALGPEMVGKTKEEILEEMEPEIEGAKRKAKFFRESGRRKHDVDLYIDANDFVIGKEII